VRGITLPDLQRRRAPLLGLVARRCTPNDPVPGPGRVRGARIGHDNRRRHHVAERLVRLHLNDDLLWLVLLGWGGGEHLGLPMLRGGHGHGRGRRNGVVERRGRVSRVLMLRAALNLHVVVLLLLR
jgi:hypothetical protein